MKAKKTMDETTSRYVYNRSRKMYLEQTGEISCSWCNFHKGDNIDHNSYGGWDYENFGKKKIKFPNWKLVSKNKKQWMGKPIKITETENRWGVYIEITF